MPAACNQAFEDCSLATLTVEMKHLRIKFVGKLDNLPLLHIKRLGSKASANFQVIEVVLFHPEDGVSHIHALKLRIEQRAKCVVIRSTIMNPRDCVDSSFPVAHTPIKTTRRRRNARNEHDWRTSSGSSCGRAGWSESTVYRYRSSQRPNLGEW